MNFKHARPFLRLSATALVLTFAVQMSSLAFQESSGNIAPQLYVTLQFDKPEYVPSETVTLKGNVRDGETGPPVASVLVSLSVDDPTRNIVYVGTVETNNNGDYSASFGLGPSAEQGQYSAFAVASKPGFTDGVASSNFQVIPEFALANVGLMLTVLLFVVALRKRRTIR